MSPDFEFLNSPIWYIRCADAGFPNGTAVSEGSSVAIRLRGASNSSYSRNYLLTCAHVIRKTAAGQQLGPRYADIRAWPPGSGYNPAGGFVLEPVADALPVPSVAVDKFYLQTVPDVPSSDWALLAFTEAAKSNDMGLPCAEEWGETSPQRGTECYIVGYPGGVAGFGGHDHAKNDTVRPSLPYGHQLVASAGNGVIEFQGSHSRAGMSGGGVFVAESGTFIGLHRERNDLTQQLHAVSAMQIRHILQNSCGYEVALGHGINKVTQSSVSFDPDSLSPVQLAAIATTLLKMASADCRFGSHIELSIGSKGKLTLTLSELAADSLQRMALKNDVGLLEAQESQIRRFEDLIATAAGGAMNVELLLQRAEAAREKTTNSIRDRVKLLVTQFVVST